MSTASVPLPSAARADRRSLPATRQSAQGAGTRWAAELTKLNHPAHALYQAVADKVVGVCGGCADVFGATEAVKTSGLPIVREKEIPGTSGVVDLSKYLDGGYRLLTF